MVTDKHLNSFRDKAEKVRPEYIVTTSNVPEVGQLMFCHTAQTKETMNTSIVLMVAQYYDFKGLYVVMTMNSYYIVLAKSE